MDFKELLNSYYDQLGCTQSELASSSSLSVSVINRYLSGEREPLLQSEHLKSLANGLALLFVQKNISSEEYSSDALYEALSTCLEKKNASYESFVEHFKTIIDLFDVNMKQLASGINFEVSYLYRVRQGKRHPVHLGKFCQLVADFLADKYTSSEYLSLAASLFSVTVEDLQDRSTYARELVNYLMTPSTKEFSFEENADDLPAAECMAPFLQKMDEFNLNDYIEAIHFNDLKVPNIPFYRVSSKTYRGLDNFRKAELDFFKATVLYKSKEPIFMYSNMPMTEMATDMDFNKKWMFGIAMSLRKGLHLNIIHNLDRPFEELMLGLEAWIPIYMTGQISPYYFPSQGADNYNHLHYVSGSVALFGECVKNHHADGKYYLTSNKEEVSYYKTNAAHLLSQARPLMQIFTGERAKDFSEFLQTYAQKKGMRRILSASLPTFTISDELLSRILERSSLSKEQKNNLQKQVATEKANIKTILSHDEILFETGCLSLSEEEFEKLPLSLFVFGFSDEAKLQMTYEEYKEHLLLTKKYADTNKNLSLVAREDFVFRNIQIEILRGSSVLISKEKSPAIHFVIEHPTMVDALERFTPPVTEE